MNLLKGGGCAFELQHAHSLWSVLTGPITPATAPDLQHVKLCCITLMLRIKDGGRYVCRHTDACPSKQTSLYTACRHEWVKQNRFLDSLNAFRCFYLQTKESMLSSFRVSKKACFGFLSIMTSAGSSHTYLCTIYCSNVQKKTWRRIIQTCLFSKVT